MSQTTRVFYLWSLQSTSATHFSYSSKYRRTSLRKTYHRVFDFSNQKARVRAIFCDLLANFNYLIAQVFMREDSQNHPATAAYADVYNDKFICAENIYARYFWGRYFINTTLLVMIHISLTQKLAS